MESLTRPATIVNPNIDFGGTPEIQIGVEPRATQLIEQNKGFFGNIQSVLGNTLNTVLNTASQTASNAATIISHGWIADLANRNGYPVNVDQSPISNSTTQTAPKVTTIEEDQNKTILYVGIGAGLALVLGVVLSRGFK